MKVLIPTAGIGARLGDLTSHYNKALLPVGKRPVISYIIDMYPKDTEFIIAVGYKGDYLKQYIELAYPTTKVIFVEIDLYEGPGAGLGYTLKKCKHLLDQEFVFHVNDAIVIDKSLCFPFQTDTLFVNSGKADPKRYRTLTFDSKTQKVKQIYDKTEKPLENVFNCIGVHYIKRYKEFAEGLENISVEIGELDYFMRNLDDNVEAYVVDKWYDIGNIEQYRLALSELADFKNLSKPDEAIYFKGTRVYKFSTNEIFIRKRVERASLLSGLVPKIVARTKNFYVYDYIPGKLLSEEVSVLPDFQLLLNWSLKSLWKPIKLNQTDQNKFENTYFQFYYEKTMDRLDAFYSMYDFKDKSEKINGVSTPTLSTLLEMIDWSDLKRGVPVLCHGDYHFENILRTESEFRLLDWRQGFGDEIKYGDLYYDLAKLLHGLIVNHQIIRDEQFTIQIEGRNAEFDFHRKYSLIECEKYFYNFVRENGWSWKRTRVVTALIYLNIACLHHYPYSHFLYYLGKSMLWQIFNDKSTKESDLSVE